MAETLAVAVVESDPAPPILWPSLDQETLLATAMTHWKLVQQAENTTRVNMLDDKRFEAGEQWPEVVRQQRHIDQRPCLVIDRMGTHLRQIVNEGRQHRPGIIVSAVDDQADPETAKILRGLVRDIEAQSNADVAYTISRQNAVGPGRGFVRVLPVYVDDLGFRQELRIEPIRNLFSVYVDPSHQRPDGSDMNWCFIVTRLAKDVYEQMYRRLPLEASHWAAEGDSWVTQDEVMVAEYWWREWHPLELALLDDETVLPVDRVPPERQAAIVKTRTTRVPEVWQAKLNGHEVLEQTRWLGRYIPVAQQVGEVVDIEGEVDYRGLTRRLKDPQRMANYWFTAFTEGLALAPKNAYVGAFEQFQGFEQYWTTANSRNWPYLPYNPVAAPGGGALPPPQRSAVEPAVQAMVQGVAMADDHIKAISGYQDQVRDDEPGISGEAIRRRQLQTNTASFHFPDNERWMIRHIGRILIDAIPHYYDAPQVVRIVGDDEQVRQVLINQRHVDEDGQDRLYDLTVGRYDVRIDGGPSFATKRQDAVDKIGPIIGAAPQLIGVIGDDYFKSLDVDYAEHMAERIRRTMAPELLEGEPGAAKSKAVAEKMQQLQQLPQLLEQVQKQEAQIASMMQNLQSMTMDNQQLRLEVQNKERELALKQQLEEHKLALQAQEQAHEARMAELELEIDRYEARTGRIKAEQPPASNGTGRA